MTGDVAGCSGDMDEDERRSLYNDYDDSSAGRAGDEGDNIRGDNHVIEFSFFLH